LSSTTEIVWLSHLMWERKLFQRPQQLATCFESLGWRVRYYATVGSKRFAKLTESERTVPFGENGIARNLPMLPLTGKLDAMRAATRQLVFSKVEKRSADRRIVWLQHPFFAPLLDKLDADKIVYDIMDPFEAFEGRFGDEVTLDKLVLQKADCIFTGGRSLHQQREGAHERMHCFPSGVETTHFEKALEPGNVASELSSISNPVLAYIGAVDERIDWELLTQVCRAKPEWNVVMIGPQLGAAPADLPENLRLLGGQPYERLPEFLRGVDVALIPWKVNELTRYMSPTKTPEYLAAGRPVVSTKVPDVVKDYGDVVHFGESVSDFIEACEAALAKGPEKGGKPPQARTWMETAEAMKALLENG